MVAISIGLVTHTISSILASLKELTSSVGWLGEQLIRKCEIIFKKLSAIELRQCHDSLSESEAIRLLEQEFEDWVPEVSMDYFHRQFQYFMWTLHCVRKGLGLESNDQLQGELLAIHLKYNLKQQWDRDGKIWNKLRILKRYNTFFKDIQDIESPSDLQKEMKLWRVSCVRRVLLMALSTTAPYFLPGVGTPKRGWAEQGELAKAAGEEAAVEASCTL